MNQKLTRNEAIAGVLTLVAFIGIIATLGVAYGFGLDNNLSDQDLKNRENPVRIAIVLLSAVILASLTYCIYSLVYARRKK